MLYLSVKHAVPIKQQSMVGVIMIYVLSYIFTITALYSYKKNFIIYIFSIIICN
jgi:hypothetical protein